MTLEIYVNVTTRPALDQGTVSAVNLDLDVVRWRDGRVEVLDEDEFAEHQVLLGYPAELISAGPADLRLAGRGGLVADRAVRAGRGGLAGPGPAAALTVRQLARGVQPGWLPVRAASNCGTRPSARAPAIGSL